MSKEIEKKLKIIECDKIDINHREIIIVKKKEDLIWLANECIFRCDNWDYVFADDMIFACEVRNGR